MDKTTVFHYTAIALFSLSAMAYGAGLLLYKRNRSLPLSIFFLVGMLANLAALVCRGLDVAHAPFQTRYEAWLLTSLCIALGYVIVYVANKLYAEGRFTWLVANGLGLLTSLLIVLALYRTATCDAYKSPLPPALQSAWFWPHVTVYIFGYGSLAVAFCASVLYLLMRLARRERLKHAHEEPEEIKLLDAFIYRVIAVGFPFLSMGLVFGALWAHSAWASYWGWDSKEVWSLITWIVYLIYLHLRLTKGWRGTKAAVFVVAGALAIVITFEFFGFLPASQTSVHKY